MTNVTKRNILGWGIIAAPLLLFIVSTIVGDTEQNGLVNWSALIVTHLPFFALPIWVLFRGGTFNRAVMYGWLTFFVSEVLWNAFYFSFYKEYGWSPPGPPGGIIMGIFLGWWPGLIAATIGIGCKRGIDKVWPTET